MGLTRGAVWNSFSIKDEGKAKRRTPILLSGTDLNEKSFTQRQIKPSDEITRPTYYVIIISHKKKTHTK